MKTFALFFILLVSAHAFAAGETTSTLSPAQAEISTWYSNPSLVGGLKSYNTLGRATDFSTPSENPKGRTFKSKNEMYLGVKAASGWGVFGQVVQTAASFNNDSLNKNSPQDPSVTITHPVYDDGTTKISGQYRQYFPVSDFSTKANSWGHAYYSFLNVKMRAGYDFSNTIIPRYYSQPSYAPTDTQFYTEDYTSVSKAFAPWLKLGLGQHTQVETHSVTATGVVVEAYPYADFVMSKNLVFGPRVYFPVYVKDMVYDTPRAVSTNQIQGEFYLQATL